MKVLALVLNVLTTTLLVTHCNAIKINLSSQEDVCYLFQDGAVLRKPGSCTETIKCKDGQSSPHTVKCTSDKIVKLDKMTCSADSVKTPDKYCTATCTRSSPRFIQGSKSCSDWAECSKGKVILYGSCPDGQVFEEDQQRCIYEYEECDKTFHICDLAKTNQPFWDKVNCARYYYCNAKKEIKSARCPLSTYYNVKTGKCVDKTQVTCLQHPVPDEACGTKKRALLNRFIGDQSTCRGYFYCKDLGRSEDGNYIPDESPGWGQCGPTQFFDAKFEYCRDMNSIKCNNDRCDGRENGVVLSEKFGCQHYLVCKEGYTIEEVKCPGNQYFDPSQEQCVNEPQWYAACSQN